jgi:hypothetical protein
LAPDLLIRAKNQLLLAKLTVAAGFSLRQPKLAAIFLKCHLFNALINNKLPSGMPSVPPVKVKLGV